MKPVIAQMMLGMDWLPLIVLALHIALVLSVVAIVAALLKRQMAAGVASVAMVFLAGYLGLGLAYSDWNVHLLFRILATARHDAVQACFALLLSLTAMLIHFRRVRSRLGSTN